MIVYKISDKYHTISVRIWSKIYLSNFFWKCVHRNFVENLSVGILSKIFRWNFVENMSIEISWKVCQKTRRNSDEILFSDEIEPMIFFVRNSSEMAFPTDLRRNHPYETSCFLVVVNVVS